MKKWLLLPFVIFLGACIFEMDTNSQTNNTATPAKKAITAPAPKLTKEECDNWYNTKMLSYFGIANKEGEIEEYYAKCSLYAKREKYDYLQGYYNVLGSHNNQVGNFNAALTYNLLALKNYNLSTKKINLILIYEGLIESYVGNLDYLNAKKYALLRAENFKAMTGHYGFRDLEFLGDICFELGEYKEAQNYYLKAHEEGLNLLMTEIREREHYMINARLEQIDYRIMKIDSYLNPRY